ncbi:spore germination protein GerPE [Neobacillus sp. LXY-4]|uniref:spore germination protein GerPE n=1 Tax=Neobacillus sp. LXY-4 TaxID=3379826 RepID=UPI003EE27BC1
MLKRTSFVDSIKVDSVLFSSIIQLGDSTYIQGGNRAIAVQRQQEIFWGQEGNFRQFRVFSEPIPLPLITESFAMQIVNPPVVCIKVRNIDIIGVSSSSIVHVGNNKSIQMEARIKHIRQLSDVDKSENK